MKRPALRERLEPEGVEEEAAEDAALALLLDTRALSSLPQRPRAHRAVVHSNLVLAAAPARLLWGMAEPASLRVQAHASSAPVPAHGHGSGRIR
jgi:hypothetical protein